MIVSIIAAMAKNRVIGWYGKIPWRLPEDLAYFKRLTTDKTVIMGRKTFESIGKSLNNRTNIVVSRQSDYQKKARGCIVFDSLEEALAWSSSQPYVVEYLPRGDDSEVFIIGGAEIYQQAVSVADRIYLTLVDHEYKGDAFFPPIDDKIWRVVYSRMGQPKNFCESVFFPNSYIFLTFERRNNLNTTSF